MAMMANHNKLALHEEKINKQKKNCYMYNCDKIKSTIKTPTSPTWPSFDSVTLDLRMDGKKYISEKRKTLAQFRTMLLITFLTTKLNYYIYH